jgi:hypothetical protein
MTTIEQTTLDEILCKKEITLPNDFYNYLINVSSNYLIYFNRKDYYPIFYDDVQLDGKINPIYFPTNEQLQIEIPREINYISYYFPEMRANENDISINTSPNLNCNEIEKAMVWVGFGSYYALNPYMIYLGKGVHNGSIWINKDSSTYNEFPSFEKVFNTFGDFLKMIDEIKQNPWSSYDDDIAYHLDENTNINEMRSEYETKF